MQGVNERGEGRVKNHASIAAIKGSDAFIFVADTGQDGRNQGISPAIGNIFLRLVVSAAIRAKGCLVAVPIARIVGDAAY